MEFEVAICDYFVNSEKRIENEQLKDVQHLKCGEIIVSKINHNLSYNCIFCNAYFSEIDEFYNHIKSFHLDPCTNQIDDEQSNSCNDNNLETFKLESNEKEKNVESKETELDNIECDNKTDSTEDRQFSTTESSLPDEDKIDKQNSNVETKNCKIRQGRKPVKMKKKKTIKKQCNPDLFCNTCEKQFSSEKTMNKHKTFCKIVMEHSLVVNSALNISEKNKIDENKQKQNDNVSVDHHETDPYTCKFCYRRFRNRPRLIAHESIHTGVKLFKCQICDKCFSLNVELQNHSRVHKGIKPYKCHICSTSFTHSSNLRVHVRRHLGDKRYKCNYCDMKFVEAVEKRHHERSHTGEKPFQCNECGKCFATAGFLSLHLKIHSGVKSFKCDLCDKAFYLKKTLKEHSVVHMTDKPFQCDQCDSKFASKKRLNSHLKTHSDVRNYICTICSKGFKQSSSLYSHMKSHGNSKIKS